jgi:hypothetical protein
LRPLREQKPERILAAKERTERKRKWQKEWGQKEWGQKEWGQKDGAKRWGKNLTEVTQKTEDRSLIADKAVCVRVA